MQVHHPFTVAVEKLGKADPILLYDFHCVVTLGMTDNTPRVDRWILHFAPEPINLR
jgi:hypothetical protein